MSLDFWFSICLSFVGIALSFFIYITKKEKTGAIIAMIISFTIALIFFILGLINVNNQANPETFSEQLQTTINLDKSTNTNDSKKMFLNYFGTFTPKSNYASLKVWDFYKDKDIQANFHEEQAGLKLTCNKYNFMQDFELTSDIHLVYNTNYKGNTNFSGQIVLSDKYAGTTSSVDVSILIDGIEVWKTEKRITGTNISPVNYCVDLKDCTEEVIIRCVCYLKDDNGIELGFF